MKTRYIILIPIITALIFSGYSYYVHEQTHTLTAQDYGCNTTITYINDKNFKPTTKITCSQDKMEKVSLIQSTVETSGYQIQPLYLLLGLVVGFQILLFDEVTKQ